MVEFLTYDLKVAVLVVVFYMFYRLLLSRETFHRVNRMVLLTTAVASFVLPLCVITLHKTVVVSGSKGTISLDGLAAMVEEQQTPIWQTIAVTVFFIGLAISLGYTLMSVLRVWLLIRNSEHHPQADGCIVCATDHDVSPFSWMNYIVLSKDDYEANDASILAHERGHIRQHHSLDLLLVDTLTALQWFNPAMWMLRQDLRAIHEYEADAAVLSQGINMRQYQYLLIQKAVSHCGYSVANGISHSTLKNRINMMLTNKKTNSASWMKLLALLPIVGTVLTLQAETVNDYVYEQPQKKVVKKGRKASQIKVGSKTIEVKTDEGAYTGENVTMGIGETETIRGEMIDLDKVDSQEVTKVTTRTSPASPFLQSVVSQGDPLIIIDGKKSTKEQLEAFDSKTIDHVDVLKDKASVEIYGEEGKNGVIIITTKDEKHLSLGSAKVDNTGISFKEAEKEDHSPKEAAFDVVEQMPEFPGGIDGLMTFLMENIHYPEAAFKAGTEGRVLVQFIVETDGVITNANVVKKVSDELDAEAIRVVASMPKWKPGKQNGKAVRVKYTIPITFRLK